MGDLDMSEQFLNFTLHAGIQQFCGIDVKPYLGSRPGKTAWLRWTKCMMGLLTSPYYAVKGTHLAKEIAWGDQLDPLNPMRWAEVLLNLPGSERCCPSLPWVRRVRADGVMAGGVPRYVDDLHPVGPSEEDAWLISHQVATNLAYLGL